MMKTDAKFDDFMIVNIKVYPESENALLMHLILYGIFMHRVCSEKGASTSSVVSGEMSKAYKLVDKIKESRYPISIIQIMLGRNIERIIICKINPRNIKWIGKLFVRLSFIEKQSKQFFPRSIKFDKVEFTPIYCVRQCVCCFW